MPHSGPILYVEDDYDDHLLLQEALSEIGCKNKVIHFEKAFHLLEYLADTRERPFLILCDFHIPDMSGVELKRRIDDDPVLKAKSIPFIFFTGTINPEDVKAAYALPIQGFYRKSLDFDDLKNSLTTITSYWRYCLRRAESARELSTVRVL